MDKLEQRNGKMYISAPCDIYWDNIPAGFDWVVVCSLRLIAVNQFPLKKDEHGDWVPKSMSDFDASIDLLELDQTDMGAHLGGIVTPLLVFERPEKVMFS